SPSTDRRTRQRPDWHRSGLQFTQEIAVGLPQTHTESRLDVAKVRPLGHQDTRLPGLEAIDIRRFNRTLGMEPTRLAAVFDIHTEDHPFRSSSVHPAARTCGRE